MAKCDLKTAFVHWGMNPPPIAQLLRKGYWGQGTGPQSLESELGLGETSRKPALVLRDTQLEPFPVPGPWSSHQANVCTGL